MLCAYWNVTTSNLGEKWTRAGCQLSNEKPPTTEKLKKFLNQQHPPSPHSKKNTNYSESCILRLEIIISGFGVGRG